MPNGVPGPPPYTEKPADREIIRPIPTSDRPRSCRVSVVVEERRGARVGTVSGLALLTGGTAIAAVAGGAQSIFATVLLGVLARVMGHALLTEIHRQARRRTTGWAVQDTANAALLATWSVVALGSALPPVAPLRFRAVGLILAFAYALSSAYFIAQRRSRIVAARPVPSAETGSDVATGEKAADRPSH